MFATESYGSLFMIFSTIGVLAVIGIVAFVFARRASGRQAKPRMAPEMVVGMAVLAVIGILAAAAVVAFVVALGHGFSAWGTA
jgi:hypothetical protein